MEKRQVVGVGSRVGGTRGVVGGGGGEGGRKQYGTQSMKEGGRLLVIPVPM